MEYEVNKLKKKKGQKGKMLMIEQILILLKTTYEKIYDIINASWHHCSCCIQKNKHQNWIQQLLRISTARRRKENQRRNGIEFQARLDDPGVVEANIPDDTGDYTERTGKGRGEKVDHLNQLYKDSYHTAFHWILICKYECLFYYS